MSRFYSSGPKMYYMCFKKRGQQGAETDIVRAKGIPTVLRQTLSEDDFRNVIFTDQPVRVEGFRRIGTANHALHLAKCQKRVLSFLDTKRWWYPCNVHSISLYRPDAETLEKEHAKICNYMTESDDDGFIDD